MSTRWDHRLDRAVYSTRPAPRWDAEQLLARVAFVVVPWLPIIGTLVYLGWWPL